MYWGRAIKDVVGAIVTVPIWIWFTPLFVWAIVSKDSWVELSIRWGLHPCSDGHDMSVVSVREDLFRVDRFGPDGIVYELFDNEIEQCNDCHKRSVETVNRRERHVNAHEAEELSVVGE